MSDKRYQLYNKMVDIDDEAPSIHQVKALRKKINAELESELFPDAEENGTNTNGTQPAVQVDIVSEDSTILDLKKVVQFIFTIHCARFGVDKLPKQVEFKFTFDGRVNAKRDEVLIAVVPCNTHFPPQSTYSTFPVAVQQCTEEQAVPMVQKLMNSAKQLTLEPFSYLYKGQSHKVDVKFVVGAI